jgi:hypothetical protein
VWLRAASEASLLPNFICWLQLPERTRLDGVVWTCEAGRTREEYVLCCAVSMPDSAPHVLPLLSYPSLTLQTAESTAGLGFNGLNT